MFSVRGFVAQTVHVPIYLQYLDPIVLKKGKVWTVITHRTRTQTGQVAARRGSADGFCCV